MKTINIVKDNRERTGWVSFIVNEMDMVGEAKAYNVGDGENNPLDYMGYGVKTGSRVSKLNIRSGWKGNTEWFYNWDRGLDMHNDIALSPEVLEDIIDDLDSLPRL